MRGDIQVKAIRKRMNLIKKILDNSSPSSPTDLNELATINSLQLFLKRLPSSPKGELECICNDCVASIRKTTVPFNYQLIIQKLYQEDELDNDDDFEEDDSASFDNLLKDEWEFLIDESLSFKKETKSCENGISITWREISGDLGDRFALVMDPKFVKSATVDLFINTLYRCEYERKYERNSESVSDRELIAEFSQSQFDESFLYKQFDKKLNLTKPVEEDDESSDEDFHDASDGNNGKTIQLKGDITYKGDCNLYVFDTEGFKFKLKEKDVVVSIINEGNFSYQLLINAKKPFHLRLSDSMNPVFDFDTHSFIFNSMSDSVSYLLSFEDFDKLSSFEESFKIALWEALNKIKWIKVTDIEKDYILNDEDDLVVEGGSDEESSSDEEEVPVRSNLRIGKLKLADDDEDSDEDESETLKRQYVKSNQDVNSQLTVGYKNNRTFVARGDTLGVFKEDDDDLKFQVAIKNIKAPGSKKSFNPSKMMLHMQDSSMILADPNNKEHLYRMDLERGQIVDDYYMKKDLEVVDFNPATKLGQLTGEQTFVGVSSQGLFKIDPRLLNTKLVENEYKSYATKNDFSTVATTDSGYLAVASNKGDIRLYDKLGLNAKTQLPMLGEPILALDVSKDGKWLLATCKTHLLLIDTEIKNGKNIGESGFVKSFGKDTKPRPRRLTLTPEHVAHMVAEKSPLLFSKLYFNVDTDDKEQTIVTSSGPYVVTWSLKKILRGDKSYLIKKYLNNVITDNFKFGGDKKVIIALEDDVAMVSRKSLRKPTKEILGRDVVKNYY